MSLECEPYSTHAMELWRQEHTKGKVVMERRKGHANTARPMQFMCDVTSESTGLTASAAHHDKNEKQRVDVAQSCVIQLGMMMFAPGGGRLIRPCSSG